MQLTAVTTDLKSVDLRFQLGPVTIFTGPNGSGKSTIIDSVELLLTDKINKIGGKPSDLFRMAKDGSESMKTLGEFGMFHLLRKWVSKMKKDKPSIVNEVSFSGQSSDTTGKGKLLAAKGELLSKLRPSKYGIDCRWFATESSAKRRKLLLDMLWQAGGPDKNLPLAEWIIEHLVEGKTEIEDSKRLDKLIDKIVEKVTALNPIDQLRQCEQECNAAYAAACEELIIAEAEIKGLGFSGVAVDSLKLAELRESLTTIDGELATLNSDKGSAETSAKWYEMAKDASGEYEAELSPADYKLKIEARDELESRKESDCAAKVELTEVIKSNDRKVAEINSAIAELERLINNLDTFDKGLCVISATIPCSTCRSDVEGPLKDRIDNLKLELTICRQAIAEATTDRTPYVTNFEKLNGIIQDLDNEIRESDRDTKRRIADEKIIAEYVPADIELIVKDIEAKRDEQQQLIDKIVVMEGNATTAGRHANLDVAAAKLRRDVRCVNAIKTTVGAKGLQGLLVKERIDPFIESVNTVLQTFDPGKKFFIEFEDSRQNEDCIFGFIEDDIRRTWETASNGEQTLIAVAMAIELMRRDESANVKALLIDNMEHLYKHNRVSLINAAKIAIDSKWIDNAIFAGAFDPDDTVDTSVTGEGIQWHHLS